MNDRYFMVSRFCAKNTEDFDLKLNEYIKTLEMENPGTEIYVTEKNEQTEDENGLCFTITLRARDKK